MCYIVYLTTNLVNGKIYVGVHNDSRTGYKGSGYALKHAFKKYGKQNFKRQILHYCLEANHAYELEAQIVDQWFVNRKDTYNLALGGKGGASQSDAAKKKLSESRMGMKFSDEHRENIRLSNLGRKHTKEHIEKVRQSRIGKPSSEESIQKRVDKMIGHEVTQDTRNKITETLCSSNKVTQITKPNGEILLTQNVSQFCKDHNISRTSMVKYKNKGCVNNIKSEIYGWCIQTLD
jgi:group I intron endonuclease